MVTPGPIVYTSHTVYGAISTGEWGLLKGCAGAYTDKGTGSAPHDLQRDTGHQHASNPVL